MTTLVPNPLDSDSQYHRFHHIDIAALEDLELLDELWALRPLLWGSPPDHWLRERVNKLEGELQRRSVDSSYKLSSRPKLKLAEGVKL